MSSIPSDLFVDILSRLPAYCVLRFRCVCKPWRQMIDDPYLIKIHLDRQLLKLHDSSSGVAHLFVLSRDSPVCTSIFHLLNSNESKPFVHMYHDALWPTQVDIVSCNGLMFLSFSKEGYLWSIWNPLTQEVHKLPLHDQVNDQVKLYPGYIGRISGFGYDRITDDYKVLKHTQVFYPGGDRFDSYISMYSLKLNSWKRIGDFPFLISGGRISGSCGVFLNGAVHWIVETFPRKNKIYQLFIAAVSLETEDYRFYTLPCSIDKTTSDQFDLGELGGCLSMSRYNYTKSFETWLMNDYGVENSWTMLFSIPKTEKLNFAPKPINYSKSKKILLFENDRDHLLLFDLENNTTKKIMISGGLKISHSQIFMTSLVRINQGKRDRKLIPQPSMEIEELGKYHWDRGTYSKVLRF